MCGKITANKKETMISTSKGRSRGRGCGQLKQEEKSLKEYSFRNKQT